MGVLLKNNISWGPKKAISEAFFEDILEIIKGIDEYKNLQNEINEAIFYYTWTLDYRNKTRKDILLLLKAVNDLIDQFDDIYSDRIIEDPIKIYKYSILELKKILEYY